VKIPEMIGKIQKKNLSIKRKERKIKLKKWEEI